MKSILRFVLWSRTTFWQMLLFVIGLATVALGTCLVRLHCFCIYKHFCVIKIKLIVKASRSEIDLIAFFKPFLIRTYHKA